MKKNIVNLSKELVNYFLNVSNESLFNDDDLKSFQDDYIYFLKYDKTSLLNILKEEYKNSPTNILKSLILRVMEV